MNKDDVQNVFKKCKIYIDNGHHPGKDRMPREAALMGCVVVTNRKGSANNDFDIPIDEKISDVQELKQLIPDIFLNFDTYYQKQTQYRIQIKNEKEVLKENIKKCVQGLLKGLTKY